MGLPIAALGVWYALSRGRRSSGAAIAIAGAAWTFAAVYFVVPHYAGESSTFYGFYDEVGGSPQGVARMLLSDPLTIARALVELHDVVYVVWLGLPLLGLFVLSPGLAAVALPQLLANGLSDFRSMTDPRYHSVAAVVPFLIAATVFGIARLRVPSRPVAASAVLVCSAVLTLVVGPWARAVGQTPLGGREEVPSDRVAALREAVATVPDGAAVTVSNSVGAHLSARRHVYSVPVLESAEWAVVDGADPWVVRVGSPILTNDPERVAAFVRRLERDPTWSKTFDRENVLVFRRARSG
jgi:uncharacterized membrane protein